MNTEILFAAAFGACVLIAVLLLIRKTKKDSPPASTPAPSALSLPDIEFVDEAPSAGLPCAAPNIVAFADTGRRSGHTHHRIEFDVTFVDFMAADHGEGHLAIMTRATLPALLTTLYRGIGVIAAASLYGGKDAAPFPFPQPLVNSFCTESWQNGALPRPDWPFLKQESVVPGLEDGATYHVVFTCEPVPGGWMTRLQADDRPSVPVFDDNQNIDPAEQAIAMASMGRGTVRLSNIVSVWTAA